MSENYCIFSAQYFPSVGGVERFTQQLAGTLVRSGDAATVVTAGGHGLPERETVDGVDVVRLPARRLLGGRLPVPKRDRAYRELLDDLARERFDHVVVNTRFYPHSLEGVRFAERVGARPVVIDHGSAYLTLGNPLADAAIARYEDAITRRLRKHPADFYGISEKSAEWLRHFGIEPAGVIGNAIDAEAFAGAASGRDFRTELGLGDQELLVAFIGRLAPEKGVAQLVEAARSLADCGGIAFAVAGKGPLDALVDEAKLRNIHRTGGLDQADVAALLQQADVLCLPSRSEGFCTALLEAAACGAIPVATDVGGAREVAPDGSYGAILPDASPRAIVDALAALASLGREERAAMAERLQQRARERFNWDATAAAVRAACAGAREGDSGGQRLQ